MKFFSVILVLKVFFCAVAGNAIVHRVRITSNDKIIISGLVGKERSYLTFDFDGDRIIDALIIQDGQGVIEANFLNGVLQRFQIKSATKDHTAFQYFSVKNKKMIFEKQMIIPLRSMGYSDSSTNTCTIKNLFLDDLKTWKRKFEKILDKSFLLDAVTGVQSCNMLTPSNKVEFELGVRDVYGIDFNGNIDQMPLLKCMYDNQNLRSQVLPRVYSNLASLRSKPEENCIKCVQKADKCGPFEFDPKSQEGKCILVGANSGCKFKRSDIARRMFHEMLHQVNSPEIPENEIKEIEDICILKKRKPISGNEGDDQFKGPSIPEVAQGSNRTVAQAPPANFKPSAVSEILPQEPTHLSHPLNQNFGDSNTNVQARSSVEAEYRSLAQAAVPMISFANTAVATLTGVALAGNHGAVWEGNKPGKVYEMSPQWMKGKVDIGSKANVGFNTAGASYEPAIGGSVLDGSEKNGDPLNGRPGGAKDNSKRRPATAAATRGVEGKVSSEVNIPSSSGSRRPSTIDNVAATQAVQAAVGLNSTQKKLAQEIFDKLGKADNRKELVTFISQEENRLKELGIAIRNPQVDNEASTESGKSEKAVYGFQNTEKAKIRAFINSENRIEIRP